jgi:hypothetical protein
MNYTKARHELHDFLGDTNYTNYHECFEGLGQLVQVDKIRLDRREFRHFGSEFV